MVSRKRKQYTMPMKRRKTNRTKKQKCKCPPKSAQTVFGQRDVRELIFGEKAKNPLARLIARQPAIRARRAEKARKRKQIQDEFLAQYS